MRLGGQPQRHGVGPAGVGLEHVAEADGHLLGYGAIAIVHHRPDGNQALHVGHLADAAVFGERVAYHEQLFVNRLVAGDDRQAADRLDPLAAKPQAFDRAKQLGLGVDLGLDLERALGPTLCQR